MFAGALGAEPVEDLAGHLEVAGEAGLRKSGSHDPAATISSLAW